MCNEIDTGIVGEYTLQEGRHLFKMISITCSESLVDKQLMKSDTTETDLMKCDTNSNANDKSLKARCLFNDNTACTIIDKP